MCSGWWEVQNVFRVVRLPEFISRGCGRTKGGGRAIRVVGIPWLLYKPKLQKPKSVQEIIEKKPFTRDYTHSLPLPCLRPLSPPPRDPQLLQRSHPPTPPTVTFPPLNPQTQNPTQKSKMATPLLPILLILLLATPSSPHPSLSRDDESSGIQHLWCVAKNNADDAALQAAIDWACGYGGVDCNPIQVNSPCYDPTNIQSTASFVFNTYYLNNGRTEQSCDFSGSAALSSLDPSHPNCRFPFSTMMVANGSFVATGSNVNDTSNTEIVGGLSMASVTIALLFSLAWLKSRY